MLFIQDDLGQYQVANEQTVMREARRHTGNTLQRGKQITSPELAREAIGGKLSCHEREVFGCLFLDSKHRVIKWSELFQGSINSATVHPREVVKEALRLNAAAVILAHNHPSGDSQPSLHDIELTGTLKKVLHFIDVQVLDHLIVGEDISAFSELGLFTE